MDRTPQPTHRPLYSNTMDWVLKGYVKHWHGVSAHPMRETFIAKALENGVKLVDVQHTLGHTDPSTTQLYDRRRLLPTKSVALVVVY